MIIDANHFMYLAIQRGEVSHERHDFDVWKKAYEASLAQIFSTIAPVLPHSCKRLVDLGSGLGGIDVLLAAHWTQQPVITLVDGKLDEPAVRRHIETFSNEAAAHDFHKKNGTKYMVYFAPEEFQKLAARMAEDSGKADLIVSFVAYCFHLPVWEYLEQIKASCHEETVLIFDVRKEKPEWLKTLVTEFGKPKILENRPKFVRCAFRA